MEPDQAIVDAKKSAAILLKLAMETPDRSQTTLQTSDARKCIYISKQNVLEQALQSLSLKIHEARACTVGNDQVLGSVCIDVPAHAQHPTMHQKKFFGDYKLTEEDALESAKLAALLYLQKAGIILVDDVNLAELTKRETELTDCQHKLLAASSWAALFQERAELLQIQLDTARKENEKLVKAAKWFSVKEEDLKMNVLPLEATDITKDLPTPTSLTTQTTTSLLGGQKHRTPGRANARKRLFND